MSANELHEIKELNDENVLKEKLHAKNLYKEVLLRVQAKLDNYNN
jgi:hypothetical protein